MTQQETVQSGEQSVTNPFAGYSQEERPLKSYLTLVGIFNAIFALFLAATKRLGQNLPERFDTKELLVLGVATHKLSRLLAKDWVTSPFRAPFTTYEGSGGPGEVSEKPRGTGMQKALGELLTCPWCMGQWVAAFFGYGLVLAPRTTRFVESVFVGLTISDFLHYAFDATKKRAE